MTEPIYENLSIGVKSVGYKKVLCFVYVCKKCKKMEMDKDLADIQEKISQL